MTTNPRNAAMLNEEHPWLASQIRRASAERNAAVTRREDAARIFGGSIKPDDDPAVVRARMILGIK